MDYFNKNPQMTLKIAIGAIVVAIIYFGFTFILLHPTGLNPENRDVQRASALSVISNGLNQYYNANKSYPSSLDKLVPKYMSSDPIEPKTQKPYDYSLLKNGDFKLCINYETQVPICINSYY